MIDVTVTTASIPGREHLLAQAIASVGAQTVLPMAHLIRVQHPPGGKLSPWHLAHQRNRLLAGVQTEYTAILDDDDLYLPHHFETIRSELRGGVDVIYTFARVGCVAFEDVTGWSTERLLQRLRLGNCISSNSAIRTAAVREVGGWGEEHFDHDARLFSTGATWDDWDLWLRLAAAGAKFVCVPVQTWDYRSGDWERCVPTNLGVGA
jgi:hypothetical protein